MKLKAWAKDVRVSERPPLEKPIATFFALNQFPSNEIIARRIKGGIFQSYCPEKVDNTTYGISLMINMAFVYYAYGIAYIFLLLLQGCYQLIKKRNQCTEDIYTENTRFCCQDSQFYSNKA